MIIVFPTRGFLTDFLSEAIPKIRFEFDFQVDGNKITVGTMESVDAETLLRVAGAYRGGVDMRPQVDHRGTPWPMAICIHECIQRTCPACTEDGLPQGDPLRVAIENMEKAAVDLVAVTLQAEARDWDANTARRELARARDTLATAARRYARMVEHGVMERDHTDH
jgi:hypothetical protein